MRALSEYLLLDLEMSGCDTTSLIAQGIASVQTYMQRCRLQLEPGVAEVAIPEIWWEWLSSYRIWEAKPKNLPLSGKLPRPDAAQVQDAALRGI